MLLTQEDIDTALRGGDVSESVIDADAAEALILDEADIVDSESEDLEFFGLLSKEDIEALLHGDLAGVPGGDAQKEIDSLLTTAVSGKGVSPPGDNGQTGGRNVVQEDVEQLIQKTAADVHGDDETAAGEAREAGSETSTGAAASQDDIDQLLMSAIDDTAEDEGDDFETLMATTEEGEGVSQDDIDRLLMAGTDPIDPEEELDFTEASIEKKEATGSRNDIGNLISRTDLDQLAAEASSKRDTEETLSQNGDTPSEHISQSDINRLLKESLDEEDLPEVEEEEEPDVVDETEPTEPVILVADEEVIEEPAPPVPDPLPASTPRKKAVPVFKKKRLFVGVIAGIAVAFALLVITFPGKEQTVLKPQVLTFSVPKSVGAVHSVAPTSEKSIYLAGFIILAPPNISAVTYVSGDLLLDLSDASFVDLIKENEAYVRDIIYGTIHNELMTRDISSINEISLELAIRKELGRIIPRGAIDRIDFERFSLV